LFEPKSFPNIDPPKLPPSAGSIHGTILLDESPFSTPEQEQREEIDGETLTKDLNRGW